MPDTGRYPTHAGMAAAQIESNSFVRVDRGDDPARALKRDSVGAMTDRPCIIDICYLAGGDEGQFLVEKMCSMFAVWAERQEVALEVLDRVPAFGGGLKSAKLGLYGVECEGLSHLHQGVHTMIRIPPECADQRRYMSIVGVRVSEDRNLALPDDMTDWGEGRRRYYYDPHRAIYDSQLGRLEVDPDIIFAGDFSTVGGI
jgi:PCRF domain